MKIHLSQVLNSVIGRFPQSIEHKQKKVKQENISSCEIWSHICLDSKHSLDLWFWLSFHPFTLSEPYFPHIKVVITRSSERIFYQDYIRLHVKINYIKNAWNRALMQESLRWHLCLLDTSFKILIFWLWNGFRQDISCEDI